MKGLLNLRGISGQIAALVVVSIVALHLIITASFLLHRPDQPEPSSDRGHGQLAAAVQLLGAAPASERPRLSADIARAFPQLGIEILPAGTNAFGGRCPTGSTRTACSGASAMIIASSSLRTTAKPQARHRLAGRHDDFGQHPAGPAAAAVSRRALDDDAAVCRHQRHVAGPVGGAGVDRATVVLRKGRREFQPQRRRGAAARTRAGGNPLGRARAQPHARAHHRPDRRPHQNARRDQPRSAHADHKNAPALRIHRGRDPSQPHARRSRPDARDAGIGAVVPAQRPQVRGHDAGRRRQHAAAHHRPVRRHGTQGRL